MWKVKAKAFIAEDAEHGARRTREEHPDKCGFDVY
jgi:hypothetical protein